MQIKTIGLFGATCALLALQTSCEVGHAETAKADPNSTPTTQDMPTELQDGDIPAPEDVAAAPADATTTDSGLAYKVIQEGTGEEHPAAADAVTVHYTGWTTDGKMFDSSVKRGAPSTFPLNGVIAGWTEGLQYMVVGEKTRFWIPESLAYGGMPGKPAGMLVFDVELISIKATPKTPIDLNDPPAEARTTESGLKINTLRAGTGTVHPGQSDKVTVHYSGWTTDGRMFDSSVERGEEISFALNGVIAGWTEGLQLMVVGEVARLWIPEELAYKGQANAPAGLLVFDVELLGITPGPKTPDNLTAPPEDAVTTESGLVIHTMKAGDANESTEGASTVLIHFSFWDQEGKMYQSTLLDGAPAPMDIATTSIAGLAEGLKLMHLGEKARLWLPQAIAFGDQPGAPKGTVVFDVEILRIFRAPGDLTEVPESATTTESGLQYRVLQAGPDADATSPTAASNVVIHFTGWDTAGKMVGSSHFAGEPQSFNLGVVMPGWSEGLQLMKPGDTYRFWISESLGLGSNAGAPSGPLVFDLELVSFE